MSTPSPDERGELSPPERDFLARRMPVESLAESYRAASEAPPNQGARLMVATCDRGAILKAADDLRAMAERLQGVNAQWLEADKLRSIESAIRKALK